MLDHWSGWVIKGNIFIGSPTCTLAHLHIGVGDKSFFSDNDKFSIILLSFSISIILPINP